MDIEAVAGTIIFVALCYGVYWFVVKREKPPRGGSGSGGGGGGDTHVK